MAHMKIPEKFAIVLENGEQLLHRVYITKSLFANAKVKPTFIIDEKISKIIKNLISKYPELPDNNDKSIQGFDIITSRSKQHIEELENHYETLVDVFDWKEAAFAFLQEVSSSTVGVNFGNNIQLASKFLDLIVLYGKINYMVSLIGDRRIITAVYAKLYQHTRSSPEPTYAKMARWINEFESPVKKIQEEFRVLNDTIGTALSSFESTYAKRRVITQLRKDGALNLILKPEDIARPVQDQYRIELAYASRIYQWILYGYLFAPGTLNTPSSVELVRFALTEGFSLPVFKDITFPIHNEFNTLFKTYKSKTINLQKQKKLIKESAQASTQEAPRKHAERRVYIRQELEAMWNLFRDKPCLLAPKINVLLAALSLAKEEIFWYFRHTDVIPPEKVKKFYNKQYDIKEKRISSLLYLIDHLVNLVHTHKKMIQNYYLEYIAGADILGLNKVITPNILQIAGPIVTATLNTITTELKNLNPHGSSDYNFENLRSNWLRLGYLLSSSSCSLKESESKQITSRLNLIYIHSKNVDSLDQLLEEYGNLTQLWYYREPLLHVFDSSIMEGADQPTHCMIFLKLLSQFPSVVTQYNPEEKELVGKECVDLANSCLTKITNRIVQILSSTVVSTFLNNDSQLADVNAAFPLLQKRKDWKPPKDFVPPIDPGTESQFRNRVNLESLRAYEKNAFQLCTALNEFLDIVIYDHVFVPREFLRERLGQSLKQFMRQAILPPQQPNSSSTNVDTTITRPSVFESQLCVFLGVMTLIENYLDIDIGDLIRETLLVEFYAKALGKGCRIDWFPEGEIEFNDVTLHSISNFYVDLVSKKLSTPGVVYSPVKLGFLSKATIPFRAEDHADLTEMRALCNLVGPYGIKIIERELLRFVLQTTTSMKEILSVNAANLEEFAANFYKPKATELLKKFKTTDLDAIVNKSISIGNALYLRSMMRDAMSSVISDSLPYIHSSIENAFNQYNRNTFMFPEFLGVDTLALDCGLDVGVADQYLKVILRKVSSDADKRIWELLPVMFSLTFYSTLWKEAQFKAPIDGHTNDVHVLSKTVIDLLIAFGAINSTTGNESEIATLFIKFLEISSVNILRMFRGKPGEKFVPNEIQSVVVFLDKFVQQCPLLSKDVLDSYVPYSLIRNMYKDLYENKLQKQQTETSEQSF